MGKGGELRERPEREGGREGGRHGETEGRRERNGQLKREERTVPCGVQVPCGEGLLGWGHHGAGQQAVRKKRRRRGCEAGRKRRKSEKRQERMRFENKKFHLYFFFLTSCTIFEFEPRSDVCFYYAGRSDEMGIQGTRGKMR